VNVCDEALGILSYLPGAVSTKFDTQLKELVLTLEIVIKSIRRPVRIETIDFDCLVVSRPIEVWNCSTTGTSCEGPLQHGRRQSTVLNVEVRLGLSGRTGAMVLAE
jgi:hypothetical protein